MTVNQSYLKDLTTSLNSLRSKPVLHDFTIVVGGGTKRRGRGTRFPVHRVILAASSDYFNTLFLSEHFNENKEDQVVLKHADCSSSEVFQVVLEFIYTGKSDGLTKDNCFDVLAAACYLQIKHLINECSKFIRKSYNGDNLAFENPLRIFHMAFSYGLSDLKALGLTLMTRDFNKMAQTEDFLLHMTCDLLSDLLDRSDLIVSSETMVFEAVMNWLRHCWESRKKHAWDLLQKVRLGLIPMEYIRECLSKYNLNEIDEFRSAYFELLEYHTLKQMEPEKRKGALLRSMQNAFVPRETIKPLMVMHSSSFPCRVQVFSKKKGTFENCHGANAPDPTDSSLHVVQDQLYIVGGTGGRMQKFMRIYPGMSSTKDLPRLKQGRRNAATAYHKGFLYAIGGDIRKDSKGEPIYTASAERYDFQRMTWQRIADMPYTLKAPSAVVFNNRIVVCGLIFEPTDETVTEVGGGGYCPSYEVGVVSFDSDTNKWVKLFFNDDPDQNALYNLFKGEESDSLYLIRTTSSRARNEGWKHTTSVTELSVLDDDGDPLEEPKVYEVDQTLVGQSTVPSFCIDRDVYLIVRNHIYKTGVKIAEDRIYETDLSKFDALLTNPVGDKFTEFTIRL